MRRLLPRVLLLSVCLLVLSVTSSPSSPVREPVVVSRPISKPIRWDVLAGKIRDRDRWFAFQASRVVVVKLEPIKQPRQSRPVIADGDVFWQLALCESGGDPGKNTGNGFYGAFQFVLSTWRSLGYDGNPVDYSYETQRQAAQALQQRSGWSQWPACSRKLGLA